MNLHRLHRLPDFVRHWQRLHATMAERATLAESLCAPHREARRPFTVPAFSYPADRVVELAVDWRAASGPKPNWRESLICPVSGLNSRLRATLQLIDTELDLYPDSPVYISEQITPFFAVLSRKFGGLVGSEYLGANTVPGSVDQRCIRHEDATRLSFPAETFDAVLSFECLEHIPDFRAALAEMFRVLRPGGRLLLTAPFCAGRQEHTVRARLLADGSVEHLLPPEYHGDPMQSTGCLCFTHFGWDLMTDLRECHFVDPCVLALWSKPFGYLGEELLFFQARKPGGPCEHP